MNKFDRVISTLIALQTKRVITGKELSRKFGVSLRTVYRDIRSLENAGIPVFGEAGVGYSLVEGYKLPPVSLEENEALALLLAEKFMGNIVDRETQASYASAIDKIKAVVRSSEKDSMERIHHSVSFPSFQVQYPAHNFLQELIRCIAIRRMVTIVYAKPQDEVAQQRTLEPIGCYYRFSGWYLIAFCHLRKAYRTFRVDRIKSLETLPQSFDTQHPSLDEYLTKEAQDQETIRVVIDFHKIVASYTGTHKYALGLVKEEEVNGKIRMTFLTPSLFGIGQWILSFTDTVDIVEPPELIDFVRDLVDDLSRHYSNK